MQGGGDDGAELPHNPGGSRQDGPTALKPTRAVTEGARGGRGGVGGGRARGATTSSTGTGGGVSLPCAGPPPPAGPPPMRAFLMKVASASMGMSLLMAVGRTSSTRTVTSRSWPATVEAWWAPPSSPASRASTSTYHAKSDR